VKILSSHQNGNAAVVIHEDGTRIVSYDDQLSLDYPLNIDIRVTTACSLGLNPSTGRAVCAFCHESARTDGTECDYEALKAKLERLPAGTELAIGGNRMTANLEGFLRWAADRGYICNLTVNHLHVNRDAEVLKRLMEGGVVKGLGISLRRDYPLNFDPYFINHPNVVLHVIAGIDSVLEVLALPFKKVLVLGYKTFGFGVGYYGPEVEQNIQTWVWWVSRLFKHKVVSFDNLAVDQLRIRRFFKDDQWEEFYQGEHSFYIDAVAQIFAPSSRSARRRPWDITIEEYFKQLEHDEETRTG
jgi:hypothetical protein